MANEPGRGFHLSEDWLATLVGLAIVAVIGFGLLGPGAQSVKLSAAPGESAEATAPVMSGWKTSATLDGEALALPADMPTQFENQTVYALTCADGAISASATQDLTVSYPPDGAPVVLDNQCAGDVVVTFATDPILRWAPFGLFTR
ncbi:MAG: hypothetical protein KC547_15075 [Anaerolineae bacterium]|nr:hypothetical protein [Anaerolineae bacterium]MCA9907317.1 hypothetical protein [Anaerolineae bacterium]